MRVPGQKKVPIRREKLLSTGQEFYAHMREIILRINELFDETARAINYPRALIKAWRETVYDTSAHGGANTWIDLPFPQVNQFTQGVQISDDATEFKVRNPGHYMLTTNVAFINNSGGSIDTYVALRFMQYSAIDGTWSEIIGSQYRGTINRQAGHIYQAGGTTTLATLRKNDIIKVQYRIGNADADVDSTDVFETKTPALLNMILLEER